MHLAHIPHALRYQPGSSCPRPHAFTRACLHTHKLMAHLLPRCPWTRQTVQKRFQKRFQSHVLSINKSQCRLVCQPSTTVETMVHDAHGADELGTVPQTSWCPPSAFIRCARGAHNRPRLIIGGHGLAACMQNRGVWVERWVFDGCACVCRTTDECTKPPTPQHTPLHLAPAPTTQRGPEPPPLAPIGLGLGLGLKLNP